MNLSDYQWSRNPRGMHDPGDNHTRWDQWGLGWIKFAFEGNEAIPWVYHALEKNITPIVRIYRRELSGRPADDAMLSQYQEHLNAGAKWFEFYNEPNLPYEWPNSPQLDPNDPNLIRPLCDNWLSWAEFIINRGAYPGMISLSETSESWGETTAWINSILRYLFDVHYDRFRNIINNGLWISSHPYIFNHWYQEIPGGGPLSTRDNASLNYREGGWHFEYPYDPICQADDPGRTVWGGTVKQPRNDVYGVLGSGIAWLERLQEMFGVGWLPVVGTEGGIWELPSHAGEAVGLDPRYPRYDLRGHGQGTVAMFDWIADVAPPWMFGITLWRFEDYWRNGNPIPALADLSQSPPRYKQNIPPVPAIGDAPRPYDPGFDYNPEVAQQPTQAVQQATQAPPTQQPSPPTSTPPPTQEVIAAALTLVPPGPGPIHGNPIWHFIAFAPGFSSDWFFSSAELQQYWERFRPELLPNIEFIDFMPYETSLALSVIGTPDSLPSFSQQIARRWPTILLDEISVRDGGGLDVIFGERNRNGLRFF